MYLHQGPTEGDMYIFIYSGMMDGVMTVQKNMSIILVYEWLYMQLVREIFGVSYMQALFF